MDPIVDCLDSLDRDETALVAGDRTYDGDRFVKTVYRTGNFLRHCGVHDAATVGFLPAEEPETVLSLLGTILLGGTVSIEPGAVRRPAVRLGPTEDLNDREIPPGCKPVGFGSPPENPSWAYFERAVWSENPTFPETHLDPDRAVFAAVPEEGLDRLFERAQDVAEVLEPGDEVAIRASIGNPGTVVSGVFAPLIADATILLPDADQHGTVAVSRTQAPETRVLDPGDTITRD